VSDDKQLQNFRRTVVS